MNFVEAMTAAQSGYDTWAAKPHNKKWAKTIYHTPIPNDLLVNIAEAVCAASRATPPQEPSAQKPAEAIADAVLSWMVKYDLLDAGNEYGAADVLGVLDDLAPTSVQKPDEARLYDDTAPMADGEVQMTAAEDVLAWLLIEKIGVPDDMSYSPKDAQETIAKTIDHLREYEHAALTPSVQKPVAWRPADEAERGVRAVIKHKSGQLDFAYRTNNGEPFLETWRYSGTANQGQQAPWPEVYMPVDDFLRLASPPPSGDRSVKALRSDIEEFMRRLGPQWFLAQGWFPASQQEGPLSTEGAGQ